MPPLPLTVSRSISGRTSDGETVGGLIALPSGGGRATVWAHLLPWPNADPIFSPALFSIAALRAIVVAHDKPCREIAEGAGYNSNSDMHTYIFDLFWEEEELTSLLSKEQQNHLYNHLETNPSLDFARREAVEWVLKVNAYYSFSALTAILAVNYFDRFVLSFQIQREKPWMSQLAAVACLSLAAKVEETQVPLQVEETKYVFEAKTIQRMEILVLSTLQWRMNPVTPLSFLDHITRRLGFKNNLCWEFLRRCESLILCLVPDSRFMCYLPSVLASATMLHIVNSLEPCFALDCQNQLLGTLGIDKINHSVLALIPKSKDADKVEDFRPIACCNVVYKVISKIIASRLAPALISIVNPAQAAFVQNRSMTDNIFMLQELLRNYGRKRISPRCILNVDLRKAFDSVDWEFVQDMLSALQFPPKFVAWIIACISSPTYSVSYNGHCHGFFKGKRGLRQGDPLSPYLFVICLEYLSRALGSLRDNPDFNFHPKCGGLKITHLAFADDLVLFSRGIPHQSPCSWKISIILGTARDSKSVSPNPASTQHVLKLQTWKKFRESQGLISLYAGRTELVKSVLQGVECFWLSIIPIPAGVRSKIIQLCRNFLWSGNCNSNKKPLVAWNEVTMPKSEGASEESVEGAIQRVNQWTTNGEFQSKEAYDYTERKEPNSPWPKMVWHNSITPKHSFILWLGLKDRLLTKDKIQEFSDDRLCPLCRSEDETVDHLFFRCRVGGQIWAQIKAWLGITRAMQTIKASVKWLIKEARGTGLQAKIKEISLACTVYHLWEARNQRIFEGKIKSPEALIRGIQIQVHRCINSLSEAQGNDVADRFYKSFPNTSQLLPTDTNITVVAAVAAEEGTEFKSFSRNSSCCYGNMLRNGDINRSKELFPWFLYLHLGHDYGDHDKMFFCDHDQALLAKVPGWS
ncbi:similar to CYCLIN D3;2 [Actinidia rufa]|uniref:Similar to CYCLIN D32 n=1 Tax=Actinidia rufa TaxID=165716 RepID=A0A7J0HEI9_9ERIC|nr:similar to CYCLIN D3;2 [Actinidia rufa]